ncbi:tellurite resistance TerB family protein [Roseimaritima ulvae]|uniref:Tellurite resistance protein TerB n=1 Tax=Roseimaritima ulvae TaxID=980254 RepID=A0A5B9QNH5_9BACT|nr:TerB family tellurite resistance protein [Roseimaritima ulvae]QEG39452.1 Tellurite resistance protein TerB [Roseimaritima ulvae]
MDPLKHLKNIVVMAIADGALAEDEVALLSDRCVELGIGEAELQQAIIYALGDAPALQLPREPEQQEQLLRDLIRMMGADGVLAESEKRLFALAAAKMRYDSARLHALIDEVVGEHDGERG